MTRAAYIQIAASFDAATAQRRIANGHALHPRWWTDPMDTADGPDPDNLLRERFDEHAAAAQRHGVTLGVDVVRPFGTVVEARPGGTTSWSSRAAQTLDSRNALEQSWSAALAARGVPSLCSTGTWPELSRAETVAELGYLARAGFDRVWADHSVSPTHYLAEGTMAVILEAAQQVNPKVLVESSPLVSHPGWRRFTVARHYTPFTHAVDPRRMPPPRGSVVKVTGWDAGMVSICMLRGWTPTILVGSGEDRNEGRDRVLRTLAGVES